MLGTKLSLIFWIIITIPFYALVIHLTEYNSYFIIYASASPMPGPGTVVPNKCLLTLKNDASLECFENHLKEQGIKVTNRFPSSHQLTVEIPENMTIGELKQIFNPTETGDASTTEHDMKPITNVTLGCELIMGNADLVVNSEPEAPGAPAGPGI